MVQKAIETIAEFGYSKASLGQIARRVNNSKGVIYYYFKSIEELLDKMKTDYYTNENCLKRARLKPETNIC